MNENSTKTCPYCKEEIPNQAVKCMYCAKWIDEKDKMGEVSFSIDIFCSDCGARNPDYSNFCGNCGKELDLKESDDENKIKEENIVKFCPYCDSEVHSKALKCKYCGEWIEKKRNLNEYTKPAKDTLIGEGIREALRYIRELNRWR